MTNSNNINATSSLVPGLDKPGIHDVEKTGLRGTTLIAATASAKLLPVTDSASLSGASFSLAASLAKDDVRLDKVAALQAAINDGSYSVPSASVADRLMEKMSRE
jgi:flagellar biosynthesis anti-sigma factor FlgM